MPAPTEPFRIGIVPGVSVSRWVTAWRERRPGDPIEIVPLGEAQQQEALAAGEVDACFVRLPIEREGLHVIPLYREVAVAVVPREHPAALFEAITLTDLEGEIVRTEDPADAVEVIAAGVGIMLVPHSIARLHARKDVAAVPVTDARETEIAIAWPADTASEAVEYFVGIVRGRTASSSRGTNTAPAATRTKPSAQSKSGKMVRGARSSGRGRRR